MNTENSSANSLKGRPRPRRSCRVALREIRIPEVVLQIERAAGLTCTPATLELDCSDVLSMRIAFVSPGEDEQFTVVEGIPHLRLLIAGGETTALVRRAKAMPAETTVLQDYWKELITGPVSLLGIRDQPAALYALGVQILGHSRPSGQISPDDMFLIRKRVAAACGMSDRRLMELIQCQ